MSHKKPATHTLDNQLFILHCGTSVVIRNNSRGLHRVLDIQLLSQSRIL